MSKISLALDLLRRRAGELIVEDLVGYTKAELRAFVERKGGPDGQVPPFLEQTLANGMLPT